jgi:hypothetical protein
MATIFRLWGHGLISRDRTACLEVGQHVKIGCEGESENEGKQDQSETLEHFLSPDRGPSLLDLALSDVRGAVCAARHSTFTPLERHPIAKRAI